MDIKQITLPRLRIAELHSFTDQLLNICRPHGILGTAIGKVEPLFAEFSKAFTMTQASASDKKELDKLRDQLIAGFFNAIKAEAYFPHTGTAKQTAQALADIAGKYGFDMARIPQYEETVQIDNMLKEVAALDLQQLQASGLSRWTGLIQNANEAFKATSGEYIADSAQAKLQASASDLMPPLSAAVEGLLAMFYAFVAMQPTDELKKAYVEADIMANSFR